MGTVGPQSRDLHEGVVMVSDAERARGAAQDLDLAGPVRLHPDGRFGLPGVAQEGAEDEPGCHGVWGSMWTFLSRAGAQDTSGGVQRDTVMEA